MKKILLGGLVLVLMMTANSAKAQFNPYADGTSMLTAGIGITGWGVPIFARFETPVADNITVGGMLSYQSKSENFVGNKWRHTIIGISARGNYHFNELLEIDDAWDLYAGLGLGYYIWNTKYDDAGGATFNYSGSGSGGFSLGIHVGGRYFINDNIGINLEFGGGTVLGGGSLGATFLF